MIKAIIGTNEYIIDNNRLNGEEWQWDLLKIDDRTFHILLDDHSYNATLIHVNKEEKTMTIRVNCNEYEVAIRDKYDLLLQQMGLSATAGARVNTFKAPMPGLIREIQIAVGAAVKKGDVLLILEAMKMENALKSPRDGTIKKIAIEKGQAVEKGQLLVEFE